MGRLSLFLKAQHAMGSPHIQGLWALSDGRLKVMGKGSGWVQGRSSPLEPSPVPRLWCGQVGSTGDMYLARPPSALFFLSASPYFCHFGINSHPILCSKSLQGENVGVLTRVSAVSLAWHRARGNA